MYNKITNITCNFHFFRIFIVTSSITLPVSSSLLLRISPNTFAFIPIPPMRLSSRNRSNSKASRHILPCVAPVCEDMHYHKTGVPWQMNKIFIIVFLLLILLNAWKCINEINHLNIFYFIVFINCILFPLLRRIMDIYP